MTDSLEDEFLTALEEHQQKLLRICSVYAGNAEEQKDLFQEVLIQLWKAMPSFKGNSSIGTWMYRITLNVCLRIRSKENRFRKKMMRLDSITFQQFRSEGDENHETEKLERLRNCIKQLNEADKAIITLYLEELPYRVISDITGLKENTIAVKVKRIKSKLVTCMNQSR